MSIIIDTLRPHLREMAGPILFVGSGISRRYAGLPNWENLLRHFAEKTSRSYGYYRGLAKSDHPTIASMISEEFYDLWWEDDEYEESRIIWSESVDQGSSPLKIEVSKYLEEMVTASTLGDELIEEYERFQRISVDGIITTNYDSVVDNVFPDYHKYVGQDELIFSDLHGIAEIYKIHGSSMNPNSLVLTSEDYDDFAERNAYLASKLITLFVEHPIVFVGYSLSDRNVHSMLAALVAGLTENNVGKLRDRLIFAEWIAESDPQIIDTVVQFGKIQVPIKRVIVPDFRELFDVLAERERKLPARILRILKSQLFEIVKTNDPNGRLMAISDIDDDTAPLIDAVFGIGAKMTAIGVVGLSRFDIMDDVLGHPDRGLPPELIIEKVISKTQSTTHIPCFKYLRAIGALDDSGLLVDGVDIHTRVASRATSIRLKVEEATTDTPLRSIGELLEVFNWEWILNRGIELVAYTRDTEGLREFLIDHEHLRGVPRWCTQLCKTTVVYDWLKYGAVENVTIPDADVMAAL